MSKLARSTLSDKHCIKCNYLFPSNTQRIVDGGLHSCLVCPPKEIVKSQKRSSDRGFIAWLLNKIG